MLEAVIPPSQIDEASVMSPHAAVTTITVDDRVVLVEGYSGQAHALNPTGSLVWGYLDGSASLGEIIEDLSETFRMPRDLVATDVIRLVQGLGTLGYLDGVGRSLASLPVDIEFMGSGASDAESDGSTARPHFDDRYLTVPPNGWLDQKFRLGEAVTHVYEVSGRCFGVRWSRHESGEALAAMSTRCAGAGAAPPNLSIVVGSTTGQTRDKHHLYVQGRLFVSTAHDGRLARAVVRTLSTLVPEGQERDTVGLDTLLLADPDGRAILVARQLERELRHLEPRLRRRGWTFVDTSVVPVSVAGASITLPDAYAAVGIDRERFLERWPPRPGDDTAEELVLPVRRVIYASSEEPQSRAESTAHLARFLAQTPQTIDGADVARIAELTASVPVATSPPGDRDALTKALERPWA